MLCKHCAGHVTGSTHVPRLPCITRPAPQSVCLPVCLSVEARRASSCLQSPHPELASRPLTTSPSLIPFLTFSLRTVKLRLKPRLNYTPCLCRGPGTSSNVSSARRLPTYVTEWQCGLHCSQLLSRFALLCSTLLCSTLLFTTLPHIAYQVLCFPSFE